ncbi:MAG: DNA translocase FtsK, partial [Anaerolineae bacterium]|nr:DNA translocase FtsK [Anaerolineae bacterium]
VTGLIKANFPARIAFAVSTGTDSRVILDGMGAETLLGKGDMLFMSPESSKLVRIQGSYVTDQECTRLIQYWTEWADEQEWEQELAPWEQLLGQHEEEGDELLSKAIEIVRQQGSASASMLQRRMRIGYPRAASLIDDMEARGIIGPAEKGGRSREVIPFENQAESAQVAIKAKSP